MATYESSKHVPSTSLPRKGSHIYELPGADKYIERQRKAQWKRYEHAKALLPTHDVAIPPPIAQSPQNIDSDSVAHPQMHTQQFDGQTSGVTSVLDSRSDGRANSARLGTASASPMRQSLSTKMDENFSPQSNFSLNGFTSASPWALRRLLKQGQLNGSVASGNLEGGYATRAASRGRSSSYGRTHNTSYDNTGHYSSSTTAQLSDMSDGQRKDKTGRNFGTEFMKPPNETDQTSTVRTYQDLTDQSPINHPHSFAYQHKDDGSPSMTSNSTMSKPSFSPQSTRQRGKSFDNSSSMTPSFLHTKMSTLASVSSPLSPTKVPSLLSLEQMAASPSSTNSALGPQKRRSAYAMRNHEADSELNALETSRSEGFDREKQSMQDESRVESKRDAAVHSALGRAETAHALLMNANAKGRTVLEEAKQTMSKTSENLQHYDLDDTTDKVSNEAKTSNKMDHISNTNKIQSNGTKPDQLYYRNRIDTEHSDTHILGSRAIAHGERETHGHKVYSPHSRNFVVSNTSDDESDSDDHHDQEEVRSVSTLSLATFTDANRTGGRNSTEQVSISTTQGASPTVGTTSPMLNSQPVSFTSLCGNQTGQRSSSQNSQFADQNKKESPFAYSRNAARLTSISNDELHGSNVASHRGVSSVVSSVAAVASLTSNGTNTNKRQDMASSPRHSQYYQGRSISSSRAGTRAVAGTQKRSSRSHSFDGQLQNTSLQPHSSANSKVSPKHGNALKAKHQKTAERSAASGNHSAVVQPSSIGRRSVDKTARHAGHSASNSIKHVWGGEGSVEKSQATRPQRSPENQRPSSTGRVSLRSHATKPQHHRFSGPPNRLKGTKSFIVPRSASTQNTRSTTRSTIQFRPRRQSANMVREQRSISRKRKDNRKVHSSQLEVSEQTTRTSVGARKNQIASDHESPPSLRLKEIQQMIRVEKAQWTYEQKELETHIHEVQQSKEQRQKEMLARISAIKQMAPIPSSTQESHNMNGNEHLEPQFQYSFITASKQEMNSGKHQVDRMDDWTDTSRDSIDRHATKDRSSQAQQSTHHTLSSDKSSRQSLPGRINPAGYDTVDDKTQKEVKEKQRYARSRHRSASDEPMRGHSRQRADDVSGEEIELELSGVTSSNVSVNTTGQSHNINSLQSQSNKAKTSLGTNSVMHAKLEDTHPSDSSHTQGIYPMNQRPVERSRHDTLSMGSDTQWKAEPSHWTQSPNFTSTKSHATHIPEFVSLDAIQKQREIRLEQEQQKLWRRSLESSRNSTRSFILSPSATNRVLQSYASADAAVNVYQHPSGTTQTSYSSNGMKSTTTTNQVNQNISNNNLTQNNVSGVSSVSPPSNASEQSFVPTPTATVSVGIASTQQPVIHIPSVTPNQQELTDTHTASGITMNQIWLNQRDIIEYTDQRCDALRTDVRALLKCRESDLKSFSDIRQELHSQRDILRQVLMIEQQREEFEANYRKDMLQLQSRLIRAEQRLSLTSEQIRDLQDVVRKQHSMIQKQSTMLKQVTSFGFQVKQYLTQQSFAQSQATNDNEQPVHDSQSTAHDSDSNRTPNLSSILHQNDTMTGSKTATKSTVPSTEGLLDSANTVMSCADAAYPLHNVRVGPTTCTASTASINSADACHTDTSSYNSISTTLVESSTLASNVSTTGHIHMNAKSTQSSTIVGQSGNSISKSSISTTTLDHVNDIVNTNATNGLSSNTVSTTNVLIHATRSSDMNTSTTSSVSSRTNSEDDQIDISSPGIGGYRSGWMYFANVKKNLLPYLESVFGLKSLVAHNGFLPRIPRQIFAWEKLWCMIDNNVFVGFSRQQLLYQLYILPNTCHKFSQTFIDSERDVCQQDIFAQIGLQGLLPEEQLESKKSENDQQSTLVQSSSTSISDQYLSDTSSHYSQSYPVEIESTPLYTRSWPTIPFITGISCMAHDADEHGRIYTAESSSVPSSNKTDQNESKSTPLASSASYHVEIGCWSQHQYNTWLQILHLSEQLRESHNQSIMANSTMHETSEQTNMETTVSNKSDDESPPRKVVNAYEESSPQSKDSSISHANVANKFIINRHSVSMASDTSTDNMSTDNDLIRALNGPAIKEGTAGLVYVRVTTPSSAVAEMNQTNDKHIFPLQTTTPGTHNNNRNDSQESLTSTNNSKLSGKKSAATISKKSSKEGRTNNSTNTQDNADPIKCDAPKTKVDACPKWQLCLARIAAPSYELQLYHVVPSFSLPLDGLLVRSENENESTSNTKDRSLFPGVHGSRQCTTGPGSVMHVHKYSLLQVTHPSPRRCSINGSVTSDTNHRQAPKMEVCTNSQNSNHMTTNESRVPNDINAISKTDKDVFKRDTKDKLDSSFSETSPSLLSPNTSRLLFVGACESKQDRDQWICAIQGK